MRRIIFTICFTFITAISLAQQKNLPEEFFGLKFCEKYTPEQLKDAMKNNGTFFEIDNSVPYEMNGTQYLRYGFRNVNYDGRDYPYSFLPQTQAERCHWLIFTYQVTLIALQCSTQPTM